ncbi:carbohydrate ABC transporter permease [Haloimpatiens sp. FM7315]|uniref:carbohydrate ABC transporter permease n=1 Tax=Haloimpatiens sp. FM7315 TaxID=3298609 RepID=UPI00370B9B5E
MKKKLGFIVSICIIFLWSIVPIYWTLRTSLMRSGDLMTTSIKYLPLPINFDNYKKILGMDSSNLSLWDEFKRCAINSIVTCGLSTIIIVFLAIISGYAFARLEFKGKNLLFGILIGTLALPVYSVIIPLYRIIINMGLLDTKTGIILIYTAAFSPLALWMMRSFFNTIPVELEEAALVDGASKTKALITVLPLILPGIISTSIITFLSTWSQFILPLIITPLENKPLTVLLTQFVGKSSVDYGLISAAGILTILPAILIVIFSNKHLVNGLMSGSIK